MASGLYKIPAQQSLNVLLESLLGTQPDLDNPQKKGQLNTIPEKIGQLKKLKYVVAVT